MVLYNTFRENVLFCLSIIMIMIQLDCTHTHNNLLVYKLKILRIRKINSQKTQSIQDVQTGWKEKTTQDRISSTQKAKPPSRRLHNRNLRPRAPATKRLSSRSRAHSIPHYIHPPMQMYIYPSVAPAHAQSGARRGPPKNPVRGSLLITGPPYSIHDGRDDDDAGRLFRSYVFFFLSRPLSRRRRARVLGARVQRPRVYRHYFDLTRFLDRMMGNRGNKEKRRC